MARVEKLDCVYLVYSPADEQHVPFDARWQFNGNYDKPTFRPSMLLNANMPGHKRSHFFVTDGKIQYLPDSEHVLAGQTIEIPANVFYGAESEGEHA
ncbi:MAG: hypothetical protein LLF96_03085 [Eubacteriales bacterium]|nr:hypothetical protein [Eubacteriales bacterium]